MAVRIWYWKRLAAIEFVTIAIDFVPFAGKFVAFELALAQEFVIIKLTAINHKVDHFAMENTTWDTTR